jgi:hypothetical protein
MYLEGTLYPSMSPLKKRRDIFVFLPNQRILLIGIMSIPLLRSKHKKPAFIKPHDLHLSRFMITFTSFFTMGKVHKWGTFLECEAKLNYCLILGPLFWELPHPLTFPLHRNFNLFSQTNTTTIGVNINMFNILLQFGAPIPMEHLENFFVLANQPTHPIVLYS